MNFDILFQIKLKFIYILSLTVLLCFQTAFVWANIAKERIDQTIYVNQQHPKASDQNPGTKVLPFKTITKAASVAITNNKNNVGTKILIEAGIYRESILLPMNGHETDAPIIFEAKGKVIVSGSDVWAEWLKADSIKVFTHPWAHQWGLAPIPEGWEPHVTLQDVVRRREMVFVNGKPFHQVLSYSELQAERFYIDEKSQKIYIQVPEGTSFGNAAVEIAVRPNIFSVSGKTNIVLRGMLFQHGNTAIDDQAVRFYDSSHILVEDCQFLWNNWGGLGFGRSHNITLRRNLVSHNGGAGIGTWKTHTLTFEDNETSHNNWRGKRGDFTGWAVAGMKNLHTHGGIFLRHKSVDNQTHGIWFDTDCENVLVDESIFCSNSRYGIYLEANQGPIMIRSSLICGNSDYGIFIANSAAVNLERNIIHGNTTGQIMVSGLYNSARLENNWETGEKQAHLAEQAAWKYNIVVGTEPRQFLVSTTLSPPFWDHFVASLKSDQNIWFNAQSSKVFQISGGYRMDFKAWQSITGQDRKSSFTDPRLKDPANDDFTLLSDSPLLLIDKSATECSK